ncbi:prolyl 4-hydroxylase subunit alpha-1 [Musca vetustissima]|uniref:prolyl 4-hydroxylase subunit alpha-1 n=1 Tax=Musca vetustissima TaxID=27455 RepID=UPI002AB7AE25|nr:prolyl 4-hydroxylase subunit alpha-1 [Musca vetustissima]
MKFCSIFSLALFAFFFKTNFLVNGELITTTTSNTITGQDDLLELLHTEKVIIGGLRHYIDVQEQKLDILRRKTQEIQNIYDGVGDNREGYLNNPINAVTMLKRITSDWKGLTNFAEDYLDTEELTKNITQNEEITFPTDDDYESALFALLRIQDMFKLEPQRLSVGEVNGIKMGSEMSWSDCLELGLKSNENGYPANAKYWMETALEKIPIVGNLQQQQQNSTETDITDSAAKNLNYFRIKARLEVLGALMNVEYKSGNLDKALKIADEMLQFNPKQKSVIKAMKLIKDDMEKTKKSLNGKQNKKAEKKVNKTDEELMIEEICREATNSQQQQQQIHTAQLETSTDNNNNDNHNNIPQCSLVAYNSKWLLLQPLKVEILNVDPFIVIYHQAVNDKQLNELKEFLVEKQEEDNSIGGDGDDDNGMLQLTNIGLKKMHRLNEKLHSVIGHERAALNARNWRFDFYNFENIMEVEKTATTTKQKSVTTRQAGVMFNLQQPKMGGSVIFPQLQFSVSLPKGALLYWTTLNEFGSEDYRSKYYVCPVIGGSQITATTFVRES